MNPFQVLGVSGDAGDADIRRAYLEAIKATPPERNPRRFAELARAYEMIKDEKSRHRHILFHDECPGDSPLDVLVQWARAGGAVPRPLAAAAMKDFLRKCNKR